MYQIKITGFLLIVFLLVGCNSSFMNSNKDVLAEKKSQASRKASISKGNKVLMTAIVTHLNDVSVMAYHNREYFFVEIYSEEEMDYGGIITYTLNGKSPLWVREIKSDEFDKILNPSNKWSRCYMVAFKTLSELELRNMVLTMEVSQLGKMEFDFTIKLLPLQF